jgi:hypothetical protein
MSGTLFSFFAICAQLRILFLARGVLHKSTSPEKKAKSKKGAPPKK